MPSPFGGMPSSCMVFFPWASHTASAFMVIFAVPFEALGNCLLCWLLKLMHGISTVIRNILLIENNYLRCHTCWENISQEVKVNTQLPCKSVWYHVLIKCFCWEGTYGIVWYHEIATRNKQKELLFIAVMSACMHILKIHFNQVFKINVDNCGLDKSWPSQKHSELVTRWWHHSQHTNKCLPKFFKTQQLQVFF